MIKFLTESYDMVMDSSKNPLRHLDLASQHYIMQALAWMWSMVFSLSFLSIFYFHYVWGAHLLILGGICLTVGIFRRAERQAQYAKSIASRAENDTINYGKSSACTWKLDREA